MKVVKMIKNDCITGVEYGAVEVPGTEIENHNANATGAYQQMQQIRKSRNTRIRKNSTKHK